MTYVYSKQIDPSTYETHGLCENIPLRAHQDTISEDIGAIRAQEDWRRHVDPCLGQVKGSLGPVYSILSVMFPETKPDRMEILAYFHEYIAMHDDVAELGDKAGHNDEARDLCSKLSSAGPSPSLKSKDQGRKYLLSRILREMLSLDPGPASTAIGLWAEWFEQGAGRRNRIRFASLDEYLEYRMLDIGEHLLMGILVFAMGLTIPGHELQLAAKLCRPVWAVLGLTNDIFSYNKEKEFAAQRGEKSFFNSICVVMEQFSISRDEAEQMCRDLIKERVSDFLTAARNTLRRDDVSNDFKILIDAAKFMISGNLVWSMTVPRYNSTVSFSPRQLDWMLNGTPSLIRGGLIRGEV
ncbi:isoprenoid synthase domain-containing protein [Podospora aff. communis PSN243]|uniref:Isoprenoid synthase domain-containing protein n=1 Tax=Podospora aff. communis PSN243 TaxID=3040156 RepID=A0AAV9GBP6_9PEZI|nr:isoprenoid synthase domain-containing protein [Podospora aff. communis PSN243]